MPKIFILLSALASLCSCAKNSGISASPFKPPSEEQVKITSYSLELDSDATHRLVRDIWRRLASLPPNQKIVHAAVPYLRVVRAGVMHAYVYVKTSDSESEQISYCVKLVKKERKWVLEGVSVAVISCGREK